MRHPTPDFRWELRTQRYVLNSILKWGAADTHSFQRRQELRL